MLPAVDLSGTPDIDHRVTYKKREAKWKRLVSETHREWCLCGSFLNHFILPPGSLLQCTDNADGGENLGGESITPQSMDADGGEAVVAGDVDGDPDAG